MKIVRDLPNSDTIYFGAIVGVRDEAGNIHTYRIVGADEADAKTSTISMDSPLAKALLAKRIDDEVVFNTGEKTAVMSVVSIHYEAPA